MSPIIQFLDFTVNTQQQSLLKGDKRIGIASTAYKLLIYFLDHPNKTVSRNELTEYVWPNRVVTETSLDKLIQRLRKILGDTDQHKKIIRTIHGVGFVFLPEVKATELKIQAPVTSHWIQVALVLLLISFLAWIVGSQIKKPTELNPTSNESTKISPHRIALIPNVSSLADQDQAWMIKGGLHYLKEQFNQSLNIEINNVSLKTLANEEPERYAIKLTNNNKNDAAVMIEVKEVDHQFRALISIRNADGILAENSLSSPSIKSLYDDIASWVQVVLSVQSFPPVSNSEPTISQDSYAVENYIRGMSAQLSGYSAEAIKYFDLATKEDPRFWLAWYELSLAYRKQGEYKKALSIISVFENVPLADKYNLMVQNAKALNLYYLGDYSTGIEVLNAGIVVAKKSNNLENLATFLTNKALFAKALGDLETALYSTEESIAIKQTIPGNQNSGLGSAYNTLAGINIAMHDLKAAQTNAKLALEYFKKAGDKRYEATAKSRLSAIFYSLGEWHKGETLIKEVLSIQLELDDKAGQAISYLRLCDYDLLKGDFAAAESHLERVNDLMSHISHNKHQNDSFLITKINVKIKTGDYDLAESLLAELKTNLTDTNRLLSYYLLSLNLNELTNNQAQWLSLADEFTTNQDIDVQPYIHLIMAKSAQRRQMNKVANDAYALAKKIALEQQTAHAIADVMNPYILFLLETDPELAYLNLLELEKHFVPNYPFLKTKAQVYSSKGEHFKAAALLEELKTKAGDYWVAEDQLLLEQYRSAVTNDQPHNKP